MKLNEVLKQEDKELDNNILNESLLSKEDFTYRFEEWKSGKIDHLYVTGLSGGGKSTLAKQLAQD